MSSQTETLQSVKTAFNAAIDFAISQGIEAATFLDAWRHGGTSEWPEFTTVRPNLASRQAFKPIEYVQGEWYKARDRDDLEAFFTSRLPAIREAAREHGYAIGLHGSLRRDMDLIAVPWSESASDKEVLAHAIAQAACGITRLGQYDWVMKPLGRVATSIPVCWASWHNEAGTGHIDLSVPQSVPEWLSVAFPHSEELQAFGLTMPTPAQFALQLYKRWKTKMEKVEAELRAIKDPLQWTSKSPSAPGFYYWQGRRLSGKEVAVVQVTAFRDASIPLEATELRGNGWANAEERSPAHTWGGWWAGPLPQPY